MDALQPAPSSAPSPEPTPSPAAAVRTPRRAGELAAGPALLAVLAGGAVAAPGYLDLVIDGVTRVIPVAVFDAVLAVLGSLAKGLLGFAIAGGIVVAGGIGGGLADRAALVARLGRPRAALVVAAVAWALAGVAIPLLAGSPPLIPGLAGQPPLAATVAVASLGYGALLAGLLDALPAVPGTTGVSAPAVGPAPSGPAASGPPPSGPSRRAFLARSLALVGGGSLALSGAALLGRLVATFPVPSFRAPAAPTALVDAWGVTPAVTPLDDFYVVAKGTAAVPVDAATWRLSIDGLVDRPAALTLDEVRAFPRVEGYRTLQCISNPVTEFGPYIGNQRWGGVRLRDVLATVGPRPEARWVLWRAADGYTESLPIDAALDERTWLVDEMGPPGTRLTAEHGFPLRVMIAGRYGMKQPKHLVGIVLSAEDEPGYWVERGWDKDAVVRTYSRIDAPQDGATLVAGMPITVYGIASAGDRGISRVEVSADAGATWQEAELQPPGNGTGDLTWVRWRAALPLRPGPGAEVELRVRATDGTGAVQPAEVEPPLPSGATGHHRVRVTAG
ncbi:MAG: hypothetical protein RL338_660 [Chloroflexota bacterium]